MAVLVVFADSVVRLETIQKITAVSFRDKNDVLRAGAPGTRPEFLVLPESSMDAKWWILHTEDFLRSGEWRVRNTALDNAPEGREVHWSSSLIWALALGAKLIGSFASDQEHISPVATAALYIGPVLFVAAAFTVGLFVWKAFGWIAGGLFAAAFFTTPTIYRTFHLGEADHHGIVMAFLMVSAWCFWVAWSKLSVLAKSEKQRDVGMVHKWVVASGIFGGAALWISVATALPVLVGAGIGGTAVMWVLRKSRLMQLSHPWKVWGISGGLASLGFYFLEYFPGHIGMRLEVNHPLYALGWLGVGLVMDWVSGWKARAPWIWKDARLLVGVPCLLVPPIVFLTAKEKVFWVTDPFLLALHREYILEFQTIAVFLKTIPNPWTFLIHQGWTFFAMLMVGLSVILKWLPKEFVPSLPILYLPALVMQLLALEQVRWAYAATGLWILCSVAVVVVVPTDKKAGRPIVLSLALATALFALVFSLTPQLVASIHKEKTCTDAPIAESVGNGLLLRDIAYRLMESSPERIPIILTGPNSSTELAYHARLRTIGTLYWENMPGLKRAARIFAAPDEETARALILEAGITHVVIPSWENFGAPYARLYSIESGQPQHPDGAPFFKALFEDQIFPQWLRPFAYPIPTNSGIDGTSVRIFAVLPGQSAFEHAWFQGMYFYEIGKIELAREWVGRARDLRPDDPRPNAFLRKINSTNQ